MREDIAAEGIRINNMETVAALKRKPFLRNQSANLVPANDVLIGWILDDVPQLDQEERHLVLVLLRWQRLLRRIIKHLKWLLSSLIGHLNLWNTRFHLKNGFFDKETEEKEVAER